MFDPKVGICNINHTFIAVVYFKDTNGILFIIWEIIFGFDINVKRCKFKK